ncbi:MAG: NAD(P)/FAD-dependent oxidoreductase [Myxococcota bacterium]
MHRSVAILGGGPAGSTLAALLSRAGHRVGVFDVPAPRDLIVGESLVPAVVPMLRMLGVEEQVAKCSLRKQGATITRGRGRPFVLSFDEARGQLPSYSYNVPRAEFDQILRGAAEAAGAARFPHRVRLVAKPGQRVELSSESRDVTNGYFGPSGPDLVVDCSGRARLIARLLELPVTRGERRDVALFAHFDRCALHRPTDIHVDRHRRGWGWRIPLRDRVSLGVVVDSEHLAGADSSEDAFDRFVYGERRLRSFIGTGRRMSKVARYSNYQLQSRSLVGPGWVLCGDAGGFADPIFSTGTYLAMKGATSLAEAISARSRAALFGYEERWLNELTEWKRIIDLWYAGRLFALLRLGNVMRRNPPGLLIDDHITKHMTRIFTGEAGLRGYSRTLLRAVAPLGRLGARELAIA